MRLRRAVLAGSQTGTRFVYADEDQKLAVLDVRTGNRTGVSEFASTPVADRAASSSAVRRPT